MIEIDGAHGEGGGQLLRTAVSVAAARSEPIRIANIRARRRVPGLAAQHVAAVRAVAALCDARCEGLQLRSTALTFQPGRLHGGDFEIDVGTAGSMTLVLQAVLPAAVATGQRVSMVIRGGTDVRAAPPLDYTRLVLLPLLSRMGVHAELSVERRGYFPKGGGVVRLVLRPVARLVPFTVEDRGPVGRIELRSHVSHLERAIAERMAAAARSGLPRATPVAADIEVCAPETALGPGGAIVLRAVAAQTILGSGQVAERGVPAERLGQTAAQALERDLRAGATLDVHAADQMLVFLAMAEGESLFRASRISSHAATAMWLLQALTSARFETVPAAQGVLVRVRP
jgi:RNA 3'-phosphate cyclase